MKGLRNPLNIAEAKEDGNFSATSPHLLPLGFAFLASTEGKTYGEPRLSAVDYTKGSD